MPRKLVVVQNMNTGMAMAEAGFMDVIWAAEPALAERLKEDVKLVSPKELRDADVLIADVFRRDPTVLMIVGMAEAFGKPVLVLAHEPSEVPGGLSSSTVVLWKGFSATGPMEALTAAVNRIVDALVPLMRMPKEGSAVEAPKRRKVFLSYSHRDSDFLDRLLVHLRPLERAGLLDLWSDRRIRPGDRWKDEIRRAIDETRAAVLLISADFIASEFIQTNELPPLLRGAEALGTRILPIVLKPCRFKRDQHLSLFQALNDPSKPVIGMSEAAREALFDHLAEILELDVLPSLKPVSDKAKP